MHLIDELVRRLAQTAALVSSTHDEGLAYLVIVQLILALFSNSIEVILAACILTEDEVAESLRLSIP